MLMTPPSKRLLAALMLSEVMPNKLQIVSQAVYCVEVGAGFSFPLCSFWLAWLPKLHTCLDKLQGNSNMSRFACVVGFAHDTKSQALPAYCLPGGNHYTGPLQCAQDIVKREGARGLLRGWTAQYVRLGPQTTVIFVVMEELRKLTGLGTL